MCFGCSFSGVSSCIYSTSAKVGLTALLTAHTILLKYELTNTQVQKAQCLETPPEHVLHQELVRYILMTVTGRQ